MEIFLTAKLKFIGNFIISHPPYFLALAFGLLIFISYIVLKLGFLGWGPWGNLGPLLSDRWADLDFQLAVIKKSAEKLSKRLRAPAGYDEVVIHSLKVLKDIYWVLMRNPLTKIFVAVSNSDRVVSQEIPAREILFGDVKQFLDYLKGVPSLASARPFCGLDIERLLAYSLEIPKPENLLFINKFMIDNNFEFCFPCYQEKELNGALFLGSKRKGIFWPQELRALQIISHQIAAGVDKVKAAPVLAS